MQYMLADADLTALVYDRRLGPLVAASAHAAPGLRGLVEIDDGSEAPLPDEWAQSRKGLENGEFVKLCAAPLIHGNAQVAALAGLFAGETIVLLPAFDAREIWLAVAQH